MKTGSKENRRRQAKERQDERDKRAPKEQIQVLNKLLGMGIGAKKERARLNEEIKNGKKKKQEPETTEEPK